MTARAHDIHAFLRKKMVASSGRGAPPRGRPAPRRVAGPVGGGPIDIKERLKQEMYHSPSASCDDHSDKSRPCPSAAYGTKDHYLVLDSFEKTGRSRMDRGELEFNFNVQNETGGQAIGTADELSTIITIQCGEFTIPRLPNDDFVPASLVAADPTLSTLGLVANGAAPSDTLVDNPMTQLPFRRMTMYLSECGRQSFSDRDRQRHNFEYLVALAGRTVGGEAGDRLLCTPVKFFELFILSRPLSFIHGLRLQFNNPDAPVRFPPDVFSDGVAVSTTAVGAFLQFAVVDPTNLIDLQAGDRVFMRGLNLVLHTTDASSVLTTTPFGTLMKYVNRPEGHLIGTTGLTTTGPTATVRTTTVVFRLNPDIVTTTAAFSPATIAAGTSLAKAAAPTTALATVLSLEAPPAVYVAKNRIRIPIRCRGVVEGLTNYMAP